MDLNAIILASIPGVLALIAVLAGMWKDKNKPMSDAGGAYSALAGALQTSGNTIDDLFGMLAELPQLREELAQVRHDWRADNQGAWANHDKLVEVKVPPPYVPTKRYSESGTYAVPQTAIIEKKKQSGFGSR